MSANPFDAAEFRRALGSFATGVTIITTRDAGGRALGLTVNSFNSVSLEPPLVLWSLSTSSKSLSAFQTATNWAVHVLAAEQQQLSGRFATRGEDKFGGLEVETGIGEVPLLRGCMARFQCRTAFQYEGGDHVIFIGEVLSFDRKDAAPLVFHGGRYAHATLRDVSDVAADGAASQAGIGDDFLGSQLSRGHFRLMAQLRRYLAEVHLDDSDFYLLNALSLHPDSNRETLDAATAGLIDGESGAALEVLLKRELVTCAADRYRLTSAGREILLRLVDAARVMEQQILQSLSPGDAPALKSLLVRLLNVIDPAANALWLQKAADDSISTP